MNGGGTLRSAVRRNGRRTRVDALAFMTLLSLSPCGSCMVSTSLCSPAPTSCAAAATGGVRLRKDKATDAASSGPLES